MVGYTLPLGGHTRKGIDCAFAGRLYMDVYGKELPRTAREQFQYSQSASKESMQEGDLRSFYTRGGVNRWCIPGEWLFCSFKYQRRRYDQPAGRGLL